MSEFTCLVTGPSGTGKELVAQAIGMARYIPFDPNRRHFIASFTEAFYPINLSALSATLIESELFGHKRGSFTGALQDRAGYMEVCPAHGCVFLDEIGDIEPAIQVKLLRLLQSRTFQRIGDTQHLQFRGKFLAATNRDLFAAMNSGRFREDLYYRLCGDIIVTPSLREQLDESPDVLHTLILHLVRKFVGEDDASQVSADMLRWIDQNIPRDYSWPGNVRELEQCIRNLMIRGNYQPHAGNRVHDNPSTMLGQRVARGELDAAELLRHYCSMVYARTGSYHKAAGQLGLDQRTVKKNVDAALVRKYDLESD
jgi:transcriptional regulator with PAS, ATPase and Fis domain